MALAAELVDLNELPPIEDLIVPILRSLLEEHGVKAHALIEDAADMPFVLVRGGVWGNWGGDERGLLEVAPFHIHTYTNGVDGDQEGKQLQEAVRVLLREAAKAQTVVPDVGTLTRIKLQTAPRRVPDWATSQGPVQFADLPSDVWRYESLFRALVRPAR